MKYRAKIGGKPAADVLLLQLVRVAGKPVVRVRLLEPFELGTDGCVEALLESDDPVGYHMDGTVETIEC